MLGEFGEVVFVFHAFEDGPGSMVLFEDGLRCNMRSGERFINFFFDDINCDDGG